MASQLLFDCVKYSWPQFKDIDLKILGIGNHFVVLKTDNNSSNVTYCIRMALLDDKLNNTETLKLESIRLNTLSNYISKHHKWIIPIYKDIKDIYFPSALKSKVKSTIYQSIGSKTVWDLAQKLIPFIHSQFHHIGKFLAVLHSFDYKNEHNMKIPITTPKQRLLELINRISMNKLNTIKNSNVLSDDTYNECINFIKYCKENIIWNNKKDIFGFSDFNDFNESSSDECKNDNIWNKYCIVHSNLHSAHFIVDDNDKNNINGIIDWSDIRITDPCSEFRYLWTMFGDICLIKSNYLKYRNNIINYNNNDNVSIQFHQRCRVYGILSSFSSLYWCLISQTDDKWRLNITKKLISKDLEIIKKYIHSFPSTHDITD